MSFQGYLDTITNRTGATPDEIIAHASKEGLLEPGVKPMQIATWLNAEYALGRGHAMAIVSLIKNRTNAARPSTEEKVARHFGGKKSTWRPVYDRLIGNVACFGSDVDVDPGKSYLSLRKARKKFAIIAVTGQRLDIGINLKDTPADGRLEPSGSWNAMVTHRVRVRAPDEVDPELLGWLERAYAAA